MAKLWGGRFDRPTARAVEEFTASIALDARLWEADIEGSIAHARMLGQAGVLSVEDAACIVDGLNQVRRRIAAGELTFDPAAEDIHSEIERFLHDTVGAVAGKLHTARSRNDQVVTDVRLYARGETDALIESVQALQQWLVDCAARHTRTLLPGLTHTQHAQPVSLAHHLLAYFWMLQRDRERLREIRRRINILPLGSAALAGTGFPIDRQYVARLLAFDEVCANSLDAVSDRDWMVELIGACALIMTHLSRLCEELIWWSAPEFGFVELDDSVTTGSSIMPQKKNPDVAELIRGRTGKVAGDLTGMLVMLKGLPLAYNRDLQEDKHFLFDALDTTIPALRLTLLMLETATFRTDRMAAVLAGDFSNATDLADYLAEQGMPFRQAHEVVGRVVRWCIEQRRTLESLSADELRMFSPEIGDDCPQRLQHAAVMAARRSEGGTAPTAVASQIGLARERLAE